MKIHLAMNDISIHIETSEKKMNEETEEWIKFYSKTTLTRCRDVSVHYSALDRSKRIYILYCMLFLEN